MKRSLMALLVIVALALPVWATAAGPYLVTNPSPTATSYTVQGLPTGFTVTTAPDSTGTYGLKTDVSALPPGSYTVTATACLVDSTWGQVCSIPGPPFSFTKPATPASPTGMALAK